MNEYINNLIISFNKFDTMLAFLISFILFTFQIKYLIISIYLIIL